MKTFIFFSMPGHGHTNPILKIVNELVDKGNRVIFYSIDEFKSKIEATGAIYKGYPPALDIDPRISKNAALAAKFAIDATESIIPTLIDELKKDRPDFIMYDTLALWGKALSAKAKVPSIAFFTTIAFNTPITRKYPSLYLTTMAQAIFTKKSVMHTFYRYRKLAKKYGFKPSSVNEFLFNKGDLNIVFTSSYFHPCIKSFDNSFKFVGPSIYERNENTDFLKRLTKNKKIIYISAGTIFNDKLHFYQTCINAFGNSDYQVILSLGHRFHLSDLPPIPDNILVMNHVPQLDVLKRADIFITHAGFNSLSESLYYGVPMLLISQMVEQTVNALRVQELGAGIYLKSKKVTERTLIQNVEKILADKNYYTNAGILQKSLRDAGGYKKAVQEILTFSKSKNV